MRSTRFTPWLADHVLYSSYRWIAWAGTALWIWYRGELAAFGLALLVTGLVNLASTLAVQRYAQLVQRSSLVLGIDVIYAVLVLVWTGGWSSPFVAYAYSSLVLPGLVDGVRGWVMSGLSFVSLAAMLLWATHKPPAEVLADEGWPPLALVLLAPVVFAFMVPWMIEKARQLLARSAERRTARLPAPPLDRTLTSEPPRFAPPARTSARSRDRLPPDAPLVVQATRTRTAEQHVEDLRRVIFLPLPSPDMDLGAALDVLAVRFGQHTGTPARVTLLGRTRLVSPLHRQLLVRLAQEALLNVQQHAHAGTAMLTLRYDTTSVALMVQDDGVGLLDGTHERPGLHALRALYYRVSEFGGRLDVFETEGGGVTVRATLPLE